MKANLNDSTHYNSKTDQYWLPDDNTGLLLELDRAIADVESCQ